jgi:hypothetical protein
VRYDIDDENTENYLMWEIERCVDRNKHCTVALQWMSPQKYMSMLSDQCGVFRCDRAPEDHFDKGSIADLTEKLKRGQALDPLYIDLTTRKILQSELTDEYRNTYRHEGRHRAFVARKLGIELVPVIVVQDRKVAEKCLIPQYD